ncbi:hypothetical protein K8R47_00800 [archaeon]|nr:hypothetical protein [archaeon]
MAPHRKWNKVKVINEIKKLEIKLKRRPVKRDNSYLYHTSRKYFGTWNNAMKSAGFKVKNFQKVKIPKKLNQNLSYFLGLVITDGHLYMKKEKGYQTKIYTSYEEEKETILRLIMNLFDYKASVQKRMNNKSFNKKPNYEIYVSSKNLTLLLNKKFQIPSGAKSKIIRIPKIFFKTNKKNIIHFVRGLIDGDGSITAGQVKLTSSSKLFLEDYKRLLKMVKIEFKGKVRKDHKNTSVFVIAISDKNNIKKLYDLSYKNVKYYYPRKKLSYENLFK